MWEMQQMGPGAIDMDLPPRPREKNDEHPSTYVVQDRSNEEELARLEEQDHLITQLMGGPLAVPADPNRLQRVLDVGCGPGGWLIDMARTYPTISTLAGIDISGQIIAYARKQAQLALVSERVEFQVGDALRMLEYPTHFFDLVHQRLGMSFLRTWEWSKLLSEYQRVCKPRGIICITENALLPDTNSPALRQLSTFLIDALYHAGHFFTQESTGVTSHLAALLEKHGIARVQTEARTLVYHTQPATREAYARNVQRLFRTTLPFMRKWIKIPPDYQDIYQQMVDETRRPDFMAANTLVTAWGFKV
jgi:ubiquinone/menaquinone biosynthesis C-methylase UbiE